MRGPLPDLSEPVWTSGLVEQLVRASTAIARLDERISVSSVASAWQLRTSWIGYAAALQAQGLEIEEIDVFSHACGVPIPGRERIATYLSPFEDLAQWQASFAGNGRLHWSDGLPFSFDPPSDWADRPALFRALELTARRARIDPSGTPWREVPLLLQRFGVSKNPLPCLVVGDKAQRLSPRDHMGIRMRYLKGLAAAAEDGLQVLRSMERDRLNVASVVSRERRLGHLVSLGTLLMHHPVLSPRHVAKRFGLTVSGAGKLLSRGASLGFCREVSGRQAWRLYVAPGLATRFGFIAPTRGRPPSPPQADSIDDLSSVLGQFDAALAAFELATSR